ncbi:hypothetical protein NDU88_003404 [Pleurodeles waltl]|uniref:Uncharacterized protein n=1 Tax=Pleurodeles waltl TaxID=8319 RepID=A0AAV7MRJ8_PLEWA|nr:hypothetical protein NDU88_003404 [Pleurodeles waltl]
MPLTWGKRLLDESRWWMEQTEEANGATTNVGTQPQADIVNEGTQDIRGMVDKPLKPHDKKTYIRNSKELSLEDGQATNGQGGIHGRLYVVVRLRFLVSRYRHKASVAEELRLG